LETIEELGENIARIRKETESNRTELDRYASHSSLTAQKVLSVRKLVASFDDFDAYWGGLPLDEKKMILRSIIKEIRAGNGRVEIDFLF